MDNNGILFLNIAVRCLGLYEMVCAERNIEDSFTACRKHAVAVRYKTGDICCFRLSLCLIDGIEVELSPGQSVICVCNIDFPEGELFHLAVRNCQSIGNCTCLVIDF